MSVHNGFVKPVNRATLSLLQHALGLDEYGRGTSYRQHYVGAADAPSLNQMVAEGLLEKRGSRLLGEKDSLFIVTDAGREYVRVHSPKPPKLTRSQRRYRAFLDADSGLTFHEWITSKPAWTDKGARQ
jgi:hypothetical protein